MSAVKHIGSFAYLGTLKRRSRPMAKAPDNEDDVHEQLVEATTADGLILENDF